MFIQYAAAPHAFSNNKRLSCLQGLQWLLRTAGEAAVAAISPETVQEIACVPDVPEVCARALVAAGIVPTYQQLVAAARTGVQDVWVWAAATFSQKRHENGLAGALEDSQWPALAQVFFDTNLLVPCRYGLATQRLLAAHLNPATLEDLLLLALSAGADATYEWGSYFTLQSPLHNLAGNLRDDYCEFGNSQLAERVQFVSQLQAQLQQLQPAVQQQLLELAMMRGHLQFLKAAEQSLGWLASPAAVLAATQHHIAVENCWKVDQLARCRSAEQLSEQQGAQLLHAALKQQHRDVWTAALTARLKAQLGPAHLSQLLDIAFELKDTAAVVDLLSQGWNGSARLTGIAPTAVQSWLQKAMHLGDVAAVAALCQADALGLVGAEASSAVLWQAIAESQVRSPPLSVSLLVLNI
jgi:hypothetical protein